MIWKILKHSPNAHFIAKLISQIFITSASEIIRLIRGICVQKKLTTDIRDLTDANPGENQH